MTEIRLARLEDVDNIMEFIHQNWKKNHILARDKDFFLYEHKDKDIINYVIAIEENKIIGVLGFIKSSDRNSDVATVIWKALKSSSNPMLGIEIFDFLRNYKNYNILFSPGINAKTIGIYNYLDIYTNYLKQYVMINRNIKKFNILKIKNIDNIKPIDFLEDANYRLLPLVKDTLDFNFNNQEYIPYKDKNYFIKRYLNHPVYNYMVYGIYKGSILTSLIVMREVTINDSKILRIVDYFGDEKPIEYITKDIYSILNNNSYEYVDFMCFGFNDSNLQKAGFFKIDVTSTEIIAPNYFSPFVQENIKINFMIDTKEINKIRICKADGDQDRPS